MAKYIEVEKLKDIIADLEKNTLNGLVRLEKLEKALLVANTVHLPRINYINEHISNLEKAIQTLPLTEISAISKTKAATIIKVSRPTLDVWIDYMKNIDYSPTLSEWGRLGYRWICLYKILKFLKRAKEEQE